MKVRHLAFAALLWAVAGTANAALLTGSECSTLNNGASIGDVKAANGPTVFDASACYGAFYGNDDDSSYTDGTTTFTFLTKYDIDENKTTGIDIGLSAPGSSSGSFTFNGTYFFDGAWMLVLKASNCWAGWTFAGGPYTGGTFDIGFRNATGGSRTCVEDSTNPPGLSHVSIYGSLGDFTQVPEPGTLALLGLGLVGIGLARRRTAA